MLIAYLDEFGHVGPYIDPEHAKYNTHPVFGYAGFVMPSQNVRQFGAFFEYIKANLLDFEIQRDGAHPCRWEKKGAALLTTTNVQRYPDLTQSLNRLFRRLQELDGQVIYYGQVKPVGSAKETNESASDRNAHHLRQILCRLSSYANNRDSDVMVVLDATDEKARLDAVSAMSRFIYAKTSPNELKRIVEVPMQVESHLYGTIQFADWLCALIGRLSHYEYVDGSQFGWASQKFGPKLLSVCATAQSKIRHPLTGQQDNYPRHLCDEKTHAIRNTGSANPRSGTNRKGSARASSSRGISQNLGSSFPQLVALRDQLAEGSE